MISKLKVQKIPPGGAHIFVKGHIGFRSMLCLIDTGASKSVVNKSFIEEFYPSYSISETEHSTAGLGATFDKSYFVKLPKIKIGGVTIKDHKFGLLDLSGINEAYAAAGMDAINIIIGGDILLKYKCTLDYGTKEFSIQEKYSP